MPRSLGLLARSLFGLHGLLTVWCLGCCGFEPLVYAGDRVQASECAEDAGMGGSTAQIATESSLTSADVPTTAPDCGCTCQSCCAVSATRFAFQAVASAAADLPLSLSDSLIGTAPQPLYPPPKVLPIRA